MGSIPVRVTNEKPLPRGAVFSLVFRFGERSPQIALKGSFALGIQRAICAERSSDFDIPYGSHPSRRLGMESTRLSRCMESRLCRVWHHGCAVISSHALACILLRLDDIQHCVLVIYNSCGIDDMQGFALIDERRDMHIPCTGHIQAVRAFCLKTTNALQADPQGVFLISFLFCCAYQPIKDLPVA